MAHAIRPALPAPRYAASSPTSEPIPAPTTPIMIRLPTRETGRNLLGGRRGGGVGFAQDVDLLIRLGELQPSADFQFLFRGVGGEPADVVFAPLHCLCQCRVELLHTAYQAVLLLP